MAEPAAACVACGATTWQPLFAKQGYQYVQCPTCSAARLDPVPSNEQARALYKAGYFTAGTHGGYPDYAGDEAVHRLNGRRRLRLMSRFGGSPPGQLLDVGCAHGFFLDEARRDGWSVAGVEASPHASGWAREHLGLTVVETLDAVVSDPPSKVVSFFQVLEHLPAPDEALKRAAALVQPGGLVVIETWDRGSLVAQVFGRHWQQVSPPSVIHLFSRGSLRHLLDRAGLRVIWMGRTTKRVRLAQVAALLAGKHRAGRWIGRMARPGSGVGRLAISYGLGDLLTVVAERS